MRLNPWWCAGLAATCMLGGVARTEEGQPKDREGDKKPKPEGGKDMRREGDRRGALGDRGQGGIPNIPGGTGRIEGMLWDALGIEQPAKLETLSYGAEKRRVNDVPIGGIDSLTEQAKGLKVEEIYTLTDEQTQALVKLREDYAHELVEYQKQLEATNLAVAVLVKALRQKYELRANDVLTTEAKAEKEKLDALAKEYHEKRAAQATEKKGLAETAIADAKAKTAAARENNDWNAVREAGMKIFESANESHTKTEEMVKQYLAKMKEVPVGDAKAKLTTELDKAERRMQDRGQGFMGRMRGMGGAGGDRRPERNPEGGAAPAEKPVPPPDNF